MAYFIDLFSPETYDAFARSPRDISGFRLRHKNAADKIKPGDLFVAPYSGPGEDGPEIFDDTGQPVEGA